MIKQKAPKDMTTAELLDEYKKEHRCEACKLDEFCAGKAPVIFNNGEFIPHCKEGRIWLECKMKEPAPNPFTPDQLAWMREMQRGGVNYATTTHSPTVDFFKDKPDRGSGYWATKIGRDFSSRSTFLSSVLLPEDSEPLCFADYAPLEGEPT